MLPQKRGFGSISADYQHHQHVPQTPYGFESTNTDQNPGIGLTPSQTICFGMIYHTDIKIIAKSLLGPKIITNATKNSDKSNLHFHLENRPEEEALFISNSEGELLASLNKPTSDVLQKISSDHLIEFDVYVSRSLWSKNFEAARITEKNLVIPANINIYGDPSISGTVGKGLSDSHLYLQEPMYKNPENPYQNPQRVSFPGIEPQEERKENTEKDLPAPIIVTGKDKENFKNEFAVVFNSLLRSRSLVELDADRRIKTVLLPHQKEALDFIYQREFGPVPPQFSLWKEIAENEDGITCFQHVISEIRRDEKPHEGGGGILADEMGLGKTLTFLAATVATMKPATEFQKETSSTGTGSDSTKHRSRATLVLLPSHMLIKSWTEEISKHVFGGLKVCEYHGRGRETDPIAIANCDIVLSTYHTVASEASKSKCPLFKINWFRIVLDEAHTIRTLSTKLFQAVANLSAKLRWCVTGTPVQNGLEDLGSLVSFLRVPMLDTPPEFKRLIIDPLIRVNGSGSANLRVLLDSICLRRLNTLLDLPDVDQKWHILQFSASERQQYDSTQTKMSNALKLQVNFNRSKSNYLSILELEMCLRRLCNHGTFEPPDFNQTHQVHEWQSSRASGATSCDSCQTDLSGNLLVNNLVNGHYTTCGHLICSVCLMRFEETLAIAKEETDRVCPLCGKQLGGDGLILDGPQSGKSTNIPFQLGGYSSKINALLENIEKSNGNDKSIIFSGWTRTLDLVQQNLAARNIFFRRIDGSCGLPLRNKILKEFRSNSKIRILMMTTGTGAVGLNLAIANRVHILEPQWNPMVESQAVARVVRLGQKKKVEVIRYIVEDTVEQTMRSQQQRKLTLASLGWSKKTT